MNRMLFATIFTLLASTAFAGEKEHTSLMYAKLTHDSEPANIKAAALKQKEQACAQNSKNKHLDGDDSTHYIETCLNSNEAAEVYSHLAENAPRMSISDAHEKLPHSHRN